MRRHPWVLFLLAAAALAGEPARRGPWLLGLHADRVTVAWTTRDPCLGRVRWGEADAAPRETVEALPSRIHRIALEGLEPGREYAYRIVSGEEAGDTHRFRAAVRPGTPFTFVAYGDTRSDGETHRRVSEAIRRECPLFLVHTGDLVADGTSSSCWDDFFGEARPLLAEAPFFPALGNHERDAREFRDAFGGERWHSFDCGDAHFLALDSNKAWIANRRQREFAARDLEDHGTSRWVFAFFHHPPYATSEEGLRDVEAMLVRAAFVPLLERHHVTAVFNGHDHNYQHSLVRGVHYVTTAGGGAPLYDLGRAASWTVARAKAHHYVKVTVERERVTVRAIDLDGKALEEFAIEAK